MDGRKGANMYLLMAFVFLLASEFPVKAQTDGNYDLVFVTNLENPPAIFVAPTDTFNFTLIPGFDDHEHVRRPIAIDYDPVDGMVYWSDLEHASITRAFVDGTGSVVLLRDLSQPEGLTLDIVNRVMYWTDTGSDLIERATLDGRERFVVLNLTNSSLETVEPRAIAVDVVNGLLFWTDWGSSPKIERANTNGTSRMTLVSTGLQLPNSLTLDVPGERMYWCDAGLDLIESTDFLGQSRRTIADLKTYNIHPFDIAFYSESLYWTDFNYGMINLTFTPPTASLVSISSSITRPTGLHIYMDTFVNHICVDSMPCREGERCRQFHDRYQCVCKDGAAGDNCQLASACSTASCFNGGSCVLSSSQDNAYFCQCPERYSGTNCEVYDDPCTSNPCWNEAPCASSSAEFTCVCLPGFIGEFCESQSHPHDLVFVTNLDPAGIYVAPTDTFNFTLIPGLDGDHGNISRPVAIDYDPEERRVYWTDVVLSTLNRAFLDGTGVEVLFSDLQTPDGLTLDIENRVMYWTDTGSDVIERATLDGQERSVVLNLTNASLGAVEPRGIVIDTANSYLYWTDWGDVPKIERARTDQSGRRVLIDTGLLWPNSLALDLEERKLYWCDAGLDRIEYSDLLGQGRTVLADFTGRNIHPFDLVVYYDFIYWSDWVSSSILRAEASGRLVGNHGSESFGKAGGIHIFKDTFVNHSCVDSMPCREGERCRQFHDRYQCVCKDGAAGDNCQLGNYDLVFVTNLENPPAIFVAPTDTFNFTLIPGFDDHEHVRRPIAIDYDPVDGMVYWSDLEHASITRAFVDGTGSVVLLRDLSQPEGLALDVVNRVMYWTDTGSDLIERATLDGRERFVVLNLTNSSLETVEPRAIVVDVVNGLLFWTDWGSSPKIERANTNGTSRMTLVSTGLQLPNSLTLDVPGKRMYWCDAGLDLIESTDFLGQSRRTIADLKTYNIHPFDIAFYSESLYWTDFNYGMINLTFTPPTASLVSISSSITRPTGLHIYMDTFVNHICVDSMPCREGERCRQFHDRYQCVCKDGAAGDNCQLASACSTASCFNGGSCVLSSSQDNAYFCQCPERYSGTNCEVYDDPCTSNPCWNEAPCASSSAEFTCVCLPGFIGEFCESQSHPHDLVFVTNLDPAGIYVAPTDTFNFTLIPGLDGDHGNISRPVAIDYDPEERRVYWTDVVLSTLNRAFLDGTGVEVLFSDLQTPDGLTLDIENRVMYWTDTGSDVIERATLDGQERSVVLNLTNASLGAVEPRGIVIDTANSYLYWTDWGDVPKIERARTDQSGRRVLIDTGLLWPNSLALDLEERKLYWCDAGLNRIEYSDLLGQGRTVLVDFTGRNIHPFDLVVYYDFIYWSDWVSLSILRAEASGRLVGNHGSESFGKAGGIHIFKANLCQQMVCQHGSHCQLYAHSYFCICAWGYSGRNCENDGRPPTFTTGCPGDIFRLFDINQRSVPVLWPDLSATDPSTPLLWNSTHRPGDVFPVGEVTMVTYTVTDQAGNAASCNFSVSVTGVGLDCPSNVTVVTEPGLLVANVSWALPGVTFNGPQQPVTFYVGSPPTQGTSDPDGQVHVYSDYQPKDVFNIGATRVTYRVQGLGTQCHFYAIVIAVDNEPPMFSGCPGDVIIPVQLSTNQAAYSWTTPVVSDNAGPVVIAFSCRATEVLKCDQSGSGIFPVGDTKVTYNATDASGNWNTCRFKITVTVVDLVCPANFAVDAAPGSTSTSVNWMEPVLTGWDGPTNFTSNISPGDELPIGGKVVNYLQRFEYGLILDCSFTVQVIGSCPASTTEDPLRDQLTWLPTQRGAVAESFERCSLMTSKAGQPLAVRNCSIVAEPIYFQWENHVPLSCGDERSDPTLNQVKEVNVSKGNVNEVVEFLANQTSESSDSAQDVEAVSNILQNIVGAGSGDAEVTELVLETVNNVIMSTSQSSDSQSPDVNAGSSSAIIQSVETQVSLTLKEEGMVSIQQNTIHVEAVSLDPMQASNGLTFVSAQQTGQPSSKEGSLAGTRVTTVSDASEVPTDVIASIRLPANIVNLTRAGNGNSSQPLRVSFIVYADDTLFKSAQIEVSQGNDSSSLRVSGSVVSLTIEDVELVNLTKPLVIQFKTPTINETEKNRTTIQCVFWDFVLNEGVGDWSKAGCLLAKETNNTVSCNCSHATNFAILVNVKGHEDISVPPGVKQALDIISQVGCAVSIIALSITLAVYLSIKKLRIGKSRQIFIHFCFSLLMLYIVFLAGIDNARGSGAGCVFVAALLHYLTLSTMMWMAVEARNMYVSTVKVFPEDTPRYMVKACLIAWGSPLIVLTVTLAAGHGHYKHDHYCFPEPSLVLYLGLLAPIGLILLHNIITFILVMRSLLKVKEASRSQQISKRLQNAVGISALMGLTWCFGFLAIEGATFAFQLIFCLANSFQGLIVFIMFCVRREEVRAALAPYMKRLCCGRTCDLRLPRRKNTSYKLPLSESVPSSSSTAQTAEFSMSMSG